MNHSPEPWTVKETSTTDNFPVLSVVDRSQGVVIGPIDCYEESRDHGMSDEDVKRVVLCVNACKDISDEMLKRCASGTPDPVMAGENWFQLYAEAVKRIAELTYELAKK